MCAAGRIRTWCAAAVGGEGREPETCQQRGQGGETVRGSTVPPGRVLQRSTVPDFEISKLKSFLTAHFSNKRDPVSREILTISDVFQFSGLDGTNPRSRLSPDDGAHHAHSVVTCTCYIYVCMHVCIFIRILFLTVKARVAVSTRDRSGEVVRAVRRLAPNHRQHRLRLRLRLLVVVQDVRHVRVGSVSF